jgi:hypothetical protein
MFDCNKLKYAVLGSEPFTKAQIDRVFNFVKNNNEIVGSLAAQLHNQLKDSGFQVTDEVDRFVAGVVIGGLIEYSRVTDVAGIFPVEESKADRMVLDKLK